MDPLAQLLMRKYGFDEKQAGEYAKQVKAGKATGSKELQTEVVKGVAEDATDHLKFLKSAAELDSLSDAEKAKLPPDKAATLLQYKMMTRGAMQQDADKLGGQEKALQAAGTAFMTNDKLADYARSLHKTGPGEASTPYGYTPGIEPLSNTPTTWVGKPSLDVEDVSVKGMPVKYGSPEWHARLDRNRAEWAASHPKGGIMPIGDGQPQPANSLQVIQKLGGQQIAPPGDPFNPKNGISEKFAQTYAGQAEADKFAEGADAAWKTWKRAPEAVVPGASPDLSMVHPPHEKPLSGKVKDPFAPVELGDLAEWY